MAKREVSIEELQLLESLNAKYEEIADYISRQFGYGSFSELDDMRKDEILKESEEFIENWAEAELDESSDWSANTDFKKLLADHHWIGEMIMNIRDDEIASQMRNGGWTPDDEDE